MLRKGLSKLLLKYDIIEIPEEIDANLVKLENYELESIGKYNKALSYLLYFIMFGGAALASYFINKDTESILQIIFTSTPAIAAAISALIAWHRYSKYIDRAFISNKYLLAQTKIWQRNIQENNSTILQNNSWTQQILNKWPSKPDFHESPIKKKLEKNLLYTTFAAQVDDLQKIEKSDALKTIETIANFVGLDQNKQNQIYLPKDYKEKTADMFARSIETQSIDKYLINQSEHATDYLCVISANPKSKFLAPATNSSISGISDDQFKEFYGAFSYFSKFDKKDHPKDRITRVFSVPCDKGWDNGTNEPIPICKSMTPPQVYRLFCYLWINWFAGVDTKFHLYEPKLNNDARKIFEIADYVLCHSPSKTDVKDKYCIFIAKPEDEKQSYQFIGTPILHELFLIEFYNRLSMRTEDGTGSITIEFLYRNKDIIFKHFRANDENNRKVLKDTLEKVIKHHAAELKKTEYKGYEARIKRLYESFDRWFMDNL